MHLSEICFIICMFLSTLTDNVAHISNLNVTHPDATFHALVSLNFVVSQLLLLASSSAT